MEQDGEKGKKVREGVVTREITEAEVADNDVAPVCSLSLSIAKPSQGSRRQLDRTYCDGSHRA